MAAVERILGVDPGTHRMGYGVVDATGPHSMAAIDYGCIEPSRTSAPADRLVELYTALAGLIRRWQPAVMAIEELYFMKNVTTGLRVAEARGVALLAARQAAIAVAEYKPATVKLTVAGHGQAAKPQVQKMVQLLLHLSSPPKPDDAADGLALAISHAVLSRQFQLHSKGR